MDGGMLKAAFELAATAAASAYDVNPAAITAPSRGRGYKPPAEVAAAKKLALWLTVASTSCGYAELGRAIGLHRDTVCSHCADVRAETLDDDVEDLAEALRGRLVKTISARTGRWRAAQLTRALAAIHPTSSDISSDTKNNFIDLSTRRKRA
jgi:hypothetical protein